MTTTPEKIHVGRLVRFDAGYGNTDGTGAIVAVRGTVNMRPAQNVGIMRVIRADDCEVDVILFDGRMLRKIHQCGIDAPGIGIKLLDDVLDDVSHLPALVAERDAAEAIAAAKAAEAKAKAAEETARIAMAQIPPAEQAVVQAEAVKPSPVPMIAVALVAAAVIGGGAYMVLKK
jgi:hypothetical protein